MIKRNKTARIILINIIVFFLIPAMATGKVDRDSNHRLKKITTIIVDNYFPYTFANDRGKPDGFSVDLIKSVAKVMGINLKINVDIWDKAKNSLLDGKIDFLPMMAYSKERDKDFDFSVPHTIAFDAFFVRKNTIKISTIEDLEGKKIIVMNNDQAHDYLRSIGIFKPENFILINSVPEALRLLASGEGDTALTPKLVGLIVIKDLSLSNLELSSAVVEAYNRPFSFAVKEGNQILLERLNQGLRIVKETGQYNKIYEKWFGAIEPKEVSLKQVLIYVLGIIGFLALIGCILLIWSISLRKQVAYRTKVLENEIKDRKNAEIALKESEEEVRQLNRSLELRVNQRTVELEAANKELEDFVYSVSHDLRAPLRSISGFAQIIDRRHKTSLNEEGQHYFDNIIKASKQMGDLIDDLLRFSRMGRKSLNIEPVALDDVLKSAVETLSDQIKATNAKVMIPQQRIITQGDVALLIHVFINLIENAIKYHKANMAPVVDVGIEVEDQHAVISVADNGIGIEPEYHDKIFKMFQRLHSQADYPGTGIGLAAVKKALQMMGGEVFVESKPGKGSIFKIKLLKALPT